MTAYNLVAHYAAAVGCVEIEPASKKKNIIFASSGRLRIVRLQEIIYRKPPEIIVFDSARGFVKVSYRDFLRSKGERTC